MAEATKSPQSDSSAPFGCLHPLVGRLRAGWSPSPADSEALMEEAADEIERLYGLIARNTLQRLAGEDADRWHLAHGDIADSLEILYAWQAVMKSANDPSVRQEEAKITP